MPLPSHNQLQVWSCGGGTQSVAIGVLIIQGKLPKPDVCVISDTGYETQSTWNYLVEWLNPGLRSVGLEVLRIPASRWSYHGIKLRYTKEVVAIPAYSTLNGSLSKMNNFCTVNWKVQAIGRWLNETLGVPPRKRQTWIGFSRDEQRRVAKAMVHDDYKLGRTFLPLVEAVPTTRREAIKLVEIMGWPTPPRSACWMCPNHSDHEWRELKRTKPDEFEKAVAVERQLRNVDSEVWLHKSGMPLDEVDFNQPEDLFSRPCDSGNCFV